MDLSSTTILGIDPGSRVTGYGLIWRKKSQQGWIAHGQIKCKQTSLSERLYDIHQQLLKLIEQYQPHECAIEQIFTCHNPSSALKLGHARGAALIAAAAYNLPVYEYQPRQVKQAIAGYGAALKTQIQYMMQQLLNLTELPQADAADALAIALCHSFHKNWRRNEK